jgi:hypothetical protein
MSFVKDVDFLILQEMDAPTLRNIFLLSKAHYEYLNTHDYALKLKAEKIKTFKKNLQYEKCKKLASFILFITINMDYTFLETDLHIITLERSGDVISHEYCEIDFEYFPVFQYEDQKEKLEKVRIFFKKKYGRLQNVKTIKEIITDALYVVMDQPDDYKPLLAFKDKYMKNYNVDRTQCEKHCNSIFYHAYQHLTYKQEMFWKSILFTSTLCDVLNDEEDEDENCEGNGIIERLDIVETRWCIYWKLLDLFKKPLSFWNDM